VPYQPGTGVHLQKGELMKLTRASEYALHALAYFAQEKLDTPVPSHIVARAQGIPDRFLLKILKSLVSVRVLRSIKGPNGGYRLARPAKEVTVLEVVEAVDGPIRGLVPSTNSKETEKLDARLGQICEELAEMVRQRLGKVRLTDLIKK
jgi:Rrf2 family protein